MSATASPAPTKPAAGDDTTKYLISCIRYSVNGKPDFQKVGDELGLSKGAAAKRYERLLKKEGIPSLSEQAKARTNPVPNGGDSSTSAGDGSGASKSAKTQGVAKPKPAPKPRGKKRSASHTPPSDDDGEAQRMGKTVKMEDGGAEE